MFTESVEKPMSGRADVYMLPTKQRVVLYKWSHESPDTVLGYNTKTYINEILMFSITVPHGTFNASSIVSQGRLRLEIEAVGLCGQTASSMISDNDFECKYNYSSCRV